MRTNGFLAELKEAPIKENLSIRLDKRLYKIQNNTIKLTTNGKQILCSFNPYPRFQELMEKYPSCDPLIFVRENEIWLSVTFDDSVNPLPDNYCIGVDLGINRTAVTSEGLFISDKNYLKSRRIIRYIKRMINSKKKKNIHKLKKGNSCRKHLKKIRRYETNLSKNYIHHVVNKILDSTKANTIVIEDLSGIKKQRKNKKFNPEIQRKFNNRQSQVPYYLFHTILSYKAQAQGKRVETVNPYNTSKDDYRNLPQGIRKGCRYYASDGKVFDADLQASINIGQRWSNVMKKQKVNLPVSFVEPVDGFYGLNGQGAVSHPNVLCP